MADVAFTPNLQRLVDCPPFHTPGETVREVLEAAFARYPRLRGYVVDERGHLRKHVTVFVDGAPVRDRQGLADPVAPAAEVYVMQALSGG